MENNNNHINMDEEFDELNESDSQEEIIDDINQEGIIVDKKDGEEEENNDMSEEPKELNEEELAQLDEQEMMEESSRRVKTIITKYGNDIDQRKVKIDFNDGVICVAISNDGKFIAGGSCDNSYSVYSIEHNMSYKKTYENTVSSLAFSHDSTLLAVASYDATVRVIDITGNIKHSLDGYDEFEWVQFHPMGHVVIAGSVDGAIWLWNGDSGKLITTLNSGIPTTIGRVTPDGKHIVAGYQDGSIRIWSPKTQESIKMSICQPTESVEITSIEMIPTSKIGIIGAADGNCYLFNEELGRICATLKSDNEDTSVESVGMNKLHSNFAFSGSLDGIIRMYDMDNGQIVHEFIHSEDHFSVTKISPLQGQYVLTTFGMDSRIKLWDLRTKNCIKEMGGHQDGIICAEVNWDKKLIVTGSEDNTMGLFAL
ncbi:WD domain containing protein [Entamoeba histolytica]|uniref:WD domain containing protein n=2 Tax=Entamoeba histolytica TaxID=5759 RepID=A0A175JF56_ENTHI|nr:Angio-associated migratory cell protein, putative [Entamoeba histolytica HM-1:IMSS-A]GAT92319.1 WD domain containing protein [Entamoeba histolytica]